MFDRQQRDELIIGLKSVKELWLGTADVNVIKSNIIMESLRVADDVCRKVLSATRYAFYKELFQVLIDIVEPQVWQNLSKDEQYESERLVLEVLNGCIEALVSEKEIKKEIVFLPYKASMWDSLESVWQAACEDKEHCNTYVVPIPYADRNQDMNVAEWHCEADLFPDYVPVLDWHEYTLEKLKVMQPDVIFIHNPYDDCNRVTSVDSQYYSRNLKQCTNRLVYIPYYVCGEVTSPHMCQAPGIVNADYVVVQDENIKAQFEQYYPGGSPPEGKFLALGSPKFDKVLTSKKENFVLPESWCRIIQGKKVVLYNISLGAALNNSDMVCKKLRYVFDFFKNRDDVALWWRPHPLMEATFRSMRQEQYAEYEKLVAEYKRAGWGIYDDTPDANMAITYSDCYYGDDSGVLWTYNATGKPVMIENMLIQSEKKQFFNTRYVCYEAGVLWFLTNEKNVVSLFKFDISRTQLDYIFSFRYDRPYLRQAYVCLAKAGNKIIIAPCQSNGDFIEYDICTKKYKNKPIPADFLKMETNQGYDGFLEAVTYNNAIYFISSQRMAMVKYEKDTGTYTCVRIAIDEKYLKLSEWLAWKHSTVLLEDKLFMAMGNKIVEYSFFSGEAVVHVAPFQAEFSDICYFNNKFYINQYNSFDIVIFDFVDYKWRKMTIITDEKSEYPFNAGISTTQGILYLPNLSGLKLFLREEGVVSVEHMEAEPNTVQYDFAATMLTCGQAFAIKYRDSILEVYDTVNGKKSEYVLQCVDKKLADDILTLRSEKNKNGFIVKEDIISLQAFIRYISKLCKTNEYLINEKMVVGRKIYEILGECDV